MPTPPPPPINPAKAEVEPIKENTSPEKVDDSVAVAALVDMAGRSALLADQTGDQRLKRVSDFIINEVQKSGALRDLLKAMANQPAQTSDAVAHRREEERDRQQQQWQESLQLRRENQQKQAELMSKLAEKLIEKATSNGSDK